MPKKPCREGYYRDKDGNCRRRGQRYYGGGVLVHRPRRKKPKPENGGNGEPTNGGGEQPTNGGSVQMMKLKDLLQNPLNRKIDRDKVDSIKSAINKTRVIKPLVYTEIMTEKGKEKMLTDGHHRYVALKEMGYREAPAIMADGRGIETAQHQEMKAVRKLVTTLRNFIAKQGRVGVTVPVVAKPERPYSNPRQTTKQARVTVPVVGNPAPHGRLLRTEKHLQGQHDQQVHAPTQQGRFSSKTELVREYGNEIKDFQYAGQVLHGNKRERQVLRSMREDLKSGALKRPEYNELIQRIERARTPKIWESKVTKHLQGQHDQSTHDPKTSRAGSATYGTLEGGAVHMATIAVPAAVVGTLLRIAPKIGMGAIGITAAFLLYEIPQLLFRMAEGGVRGYHGKRPYRLDVKKAETVDAVGRAITRGDHVLVRSKDGANVGVSMGGNKVRLLHGKQFVDVKTTPEIRIKISTEDVVPSTNPKDAKVTEQVLTQLIQEQKLLMTFADRMKHRQVLKHGSHNQQDHAPKGTGKAPVEGKELKAQLRPAFRSGGKLFAGKRGQIHADILGVNPHIIDDLDRTSGFVDDDNNFITRSEALRRVGITTSEELREEKVTKHGSHNQQDHDPTKGRGQGALQQESRSRLRGSSSFKQLRRELQSLASNPNKPGNKERMDEIQQELAGQAREARGEVRREPKLAITTISDVKNHLGRGTKVLLSAERSNLSPQANAARTARLRQDLGAISNEVIESDSRYGGSREKGFVASISAKQAQELSNKYDQDSHIIIQGGKAEMKFREGGSMEGSVSEATERVGAEDDFSTIGGVKFTIPFRDRTKEKTKKLLKQLAELRDSIAKANRMNKEGVTATNVSGLGLVREDLQEEMAHPHPGRRRKGWATEDNFGLSQKLDMDEGVDTKHPYKNPEGAQIEGGRG